MKSTTKRRAYCYLCGDDKPVSRKEVCIDGKCERHAFCQECIDAMQSRPLTYLPNGKLAIDENEASEPVPINELFNEFRRQAHMDAYNIN